MPGRPPDGVPAPPDGHLPEAAVAEFALPTTQAAGEGAFGAYVHVPFCVRRCGYCDFNTYTPGELGEDAVSGPMRSYLFALHREIDLAGHVLPRRPLDTVFLGGGTPTLLTPRDIAAILERLRSTFGFAGDVEITTEANPDTVDPRRDAARLVGLAEAGVTRISLGMQSAVPSVLATLDRTHDQVAVGAAVSAARDLGLATSVDLIYGAPGESMGDWGRSLEAALEMRPDHVSAYALVVEEGTRLAAQVRRGEVAAPDDDDEADKYELADDLMSAAGYRWYEVSNWAASEPGVCRHNEGYWRSGHWWGFGPGAHSHVGGVRWWNVRHPAAYAARMEAGESPAQARELLTADQRYEEDVMLRIRLAEGLAVSRLRGAGRAAVAELVDDDLVTAPRRGDAEVGEPRLVLTRRGRLLADTVLHRLIG